MGVVERPSLSVYFCFREGRAVMRYGSNMAECPQAT